MKHLLAEKSQVAGGAVPIAALARSAEGMGTTSPNATAVWLPGRTTTPSGGRTIDHTPSSTTQPLTPRVRGCVF